MKNKAFKIKPISLALLLVGTGMTQSSYAIDLMAVEGSWTPPGGTAITMWGFTHDTGDCATAPSTWAVGPQLTDADLEAGNLTINLRNCLTDSVSIVIPGQPATFTPVRVGNRVTAFTTEAPPGGNASYTWTGVKAGTYLYQSGSHPAKQVQMGLYGALTIGSYPGTSGDVTLVYSEIDPLLHNPPAAATPLGYKPRHFLVNGSIDQPVISAGDTNQPTVIRLLNAGLDFHVPTINGGHMSIVAEDGNAYPFSRQQYSASMSAGKTNDVLWQPSTSGEHVIYDRRGHGMVATLSVSEGTGAPVAVDDSYVTSEELAVSIAAPGVLANDDPGLAAIMVSAPSNGTLSSGLDATGAFTYVPNPDFNGTDSFSYKASDGLLDSSVASVTITVAPVNDAPVAVDNTYEAVEGTTLNVTASGVVSNDTDIDDASLVVDVIPVTEPVNGALTLNADGSFDYTAAVVAPASDSFVYRVCDAEPLCSTATVNLNIISQPNSAPVAADDTATVIRNSALTFINLVANDSDADGNLKDDINGDVTAGQINITTGTRTTRGGTVTVLTNGVNYTPKRNFRGTDTFNYALTDADGAVSNEATVRVNVVRP